MRRLVAKPALQHRRQLVLLTSLLVGPVVLQVLVRAFVLLLDEGYAVRELAGEYAVRKFERRKERAVALHWRLAVARVALPAKEREGPGVEAGVWLTFERRYLYLCEAPLVYRRKYVLLLLPFVLLFYVLTVTNPRKVYTKVFKCPDRQAEFLA